jgi:excisionase family DNA binding protein
MRPRYEEPVDGLSDRLLTLVQVATRYDCSKRHVLRMVDRGLMPAPVHLGSLLRWKQSDLDEWIASGCKPTRTTTKRGA